MILYLTDKEQDYAADFLYDGFCELLGPSNVIDWPPKPSLHGQERALFDCDLSWSSHAWTEASVARALLTGQFDLIIIPTMRGKVPHMLINWDAMGLVGPNADKFVYYDGEDHQHNLLPAVAQCLGNRTPVAYFKREMPCGETWAIPLPFGYPARRCTNRNDVDFRSPHVFCALQVWDWARGGTRDRLAVLLANEFGGHATVAAFTSSTSKNRWSPAEYHLRLSQASVSVVPAGQGYFTNRLFESLAAGCAVVAEAPTVQFPGALIDNVECLYFRNEFQAVDAVRHLLECPERSLEIARAGRHALLTRHSTKCRAETVLQVVEERRVAA